MEKLYSYKAVIETKRKDATIKYTSKPYDTKEEAIRDMAIELQRAIKKEKTITDVYIEKETLRSEEPKYTGHTVVIKKDSFNELIKAREEKNKELSKAFKESYSIQEHMKKLEEDGDVFTLNFLKDPWKAFGHPPSDQPNS